MRRASTRPQRSREQESSAHFSKNKGVWCLGRTRRGGDGTCNRGRGGLYCWRAFPSRLEALLDFHDGLVPRGCQMQMNMRSQCCHSWAGQNGPPASSALAVSLSGVAVNTGNSDEVLPWCWVWCMMVHVFNPRTSESEDGGCL